MPDTVTAPSEPDKQPPVGRHRMWIAVLTLGTVVALAVVLASAIGNGGDDPERRNPSDPLRPSGRATLDPSTRSDTEAGVRGNWPLLGNDEFDGSELDRSHWQLYTGKTTGGVGQHNPENLSVSDGTFTAAGDFTQWHTYAVEWAPDHVAGFIDGQEIFRTDDDEKIPPRPMHLAIQQDIGPYGDDWIPPPDDATPDEVQLEVDWVRIYGR